MPGIGSKSARRFGLSFGRNAEGRGRPTRGTIVEAKGLRVTVLFALTYQLKTLANSVAIRNRDQTTIMVVETSRDVIAIERSGDYKGLYHVLEGALSPMEGDRC